MSKKIDSPVEKFPGSVTLASPLTFPQVIEYENAIRKASELDADTASVADVHSLYLHAVCLCVEKWELEGIPDGVTPDTFPATPRKSVTELASWLVSEILELFKEDEDRKNE